jgi:predicted short-subunit dehydrogenase-like oxidoreductase (DUF2520 family)
MIQSVQVIGAGRVGSAVAGRLAERGVDLDAATPPELVLLCVPDGAIAEVAAGIEPGPWVAHVSGATPLAALAPHTRRFVCHPLQTFVRWRGPEQLDGAFAGIRAETDEARAAGFELAATLGLQPFPLAESQAALYHAGAAVASNFLVTLHRIAARLVTEAGAPAEALLPLMRRTLENGFELTGPIQRGDWESVERQRAAVSALAPELRPVFDALVAATAEVAA